MLIFDVDARRHVDRRGHRGSLMTRGRSVGSCTASADSEPSGGDGGGGGSASHELMGGGHCTGSNVTLRRCLGEADSPSLLIWLFGRGRSSELVRLASSPSASSASLKPCAPSERSLVTWMCAGVTLSSTDTSRVRVIERPDSSPSVKVDSRSSPSTSSGPPEEPPLHLRSAADEPSLWPDALRSLTEPSAERPPSERPDSRVVMRYDGASLRLLARSKSAVRRSPEGRYGGSDDAYDSIDSVRSRDSRTHELRSSISSRRRCGSGGV
mmetsp:Transcript_61058/g.167467  ORF Transcript_61058/g.167467 Transcript_61058/m.167467 type:complete len:268 (-) Transcript_61058:1821-2624(-)